LYRAVDFGGPAQVLPFQDGDLLDKVSVVNPYYEVIDAFVTNE
jgi:translation initiation factor eIF-2B subunit beta